MIEITRIEIMDDDTKKIIHSEICKIQINKSDEKNFRESIKNNFINKAENICVCLHKKELK